MPHPAPRAPTPLSADSSGPRQCIGVFDSGVGGLSVLRELQRTLPGHRLHYVADAGHAPYGERDEAHVTTRSMRIAAHLVDQGAQAIVVACNTATAVAVARLREAWPALCIVGVEPGIKPALARTRNGRIGVMATAATLGSDKFRQLVAAHAAGRTVLLQACTGLAASIERGELDAPDLLSMIERHCLPLREAGVDTVVLGCTHYAFVEAGIRAALGPQVSIVDTAAAVARHAATLLSTPAWQSQLDETLPQLESTGDPARLEQFSRRWLPFACKVRAAPHDL